MLIIIKKSIINNILKQTVILSLSEGSRAISSETTDEILRCTQDETLGYDGIVFLILLKILDVLQF